MCHDTLCKNMSHQMNHSNFSLGRERRMRDYFTSSPRLNPSILSLELLCLPRRLYKRGIEANVTTCKWGVIVSSLTEANSLIKLTLNRWRFTKSSSLQLWQTMSLYCIHSPCCCDRKPGRHSFKRKREKNSCQDSEREGERRMREKERGVSACNVLAFESNLYSHRIFASSLPPSFPFHLQSKRFLFALSFLS